MVRLAGRLPLADRLPSPLPASVSSWVWLAFALLLLGSATALVSSLRVPVAYDATARVQPSWRVAGTVITEDKVDQFAAALSQDMKSSANLDSVIMKLDLPYSASQLAARINVAADRSFYEKIDVTATDSDPQRASAIANAIVAAYMSETHSESQTIYIDASAVPPVSPARPRPAIEMLVGGIVGGLIAIALFFTFRHVTGLDLRRAPYDGLVRRLLPSASRGRQLFNRALFVVSAASLVLGATVSGMQSNPMLVLIGFAPLLLVAVIMDPVWRLATVVVGGLLIFQSSQTLTSAKVAYLVVAAAIGALAAFHVWEGRATQSFARLRPMLYAAAALVAVLAVSYFVAYANGTGSVAWLRDTAPYALLILAVLLTVDVSLSSPPRVVLEMLLVLCGLASALAYANDWLQQRQYGSLPVNLPVLQSFLLPAALYVYATANAVIGRYRLLWAAAAISAGFLLFVSGTRTTVLIVAGPIAIVLWAGSLKLPLVLKRLAISLAVFAGAGVATAGFLFVASFMHVNRPVDIPVSAPATQTAATVSSAVCAPAGSIAVGGEGLQTGSILARFARILDPTQDASFLERLTVDRLAWGSFAVHPVLGVGPGHLYEWSTPCGQVKISPYLDTGISLLTKFGLLSLPFVVLLAVGMVAMVRDRELELLPRAALLGYCAVAVAWMTVEAPLEDKGLAFGLALLLALVITSSSNPARMDSVST